MHELAPTPPAVRNAAVRAAPWQPAGMRYVVAMAVSYTVVAQFEAPLGDRTLVDGACLLEKYAEDPDVCGADAT